MREGESGRGVRNNKTWKRQTKALQNEGEDLPEKKVPEGWHMWYSCVICWTGESEKHERVSTAIIHPFLYSQHLRTSETDTVQTKGGQQTATIETRTSCFRPTQRPASSWNSSRSISSDDGSPLGKDDDHRTLQNVWYNMSPSQVGGF